MAVLYSYFRSSCSYRVRIALNLKNVDYELRFINLRPDISEQLAHDYRKLNPQARVPFYIDEDVQLGQSWPIIEYIDEKHPQNPLLPSDLVAKTKVKQIASIIAADIQPLNNLAVLNTLKESLNAEPNDVSQWYAKWIHEGFAAVESLLPEPSDSFAFCYGDTPSFADIFLIPQVWNAHRFDVSLSDYPKIEAIYKHCGTLDAFKKASPESQADML